ncbi:MAG: radical SAM protein [Myxococcales bacterium]|nr:radical SAM protein [Myxococcales bacterium]
MLSNAGGALLGARGLAKPEDLSCAITVKEICVMLNFACNIRCPLCPFWGTTGVSHAGGDKRWHAPFDSASMRRFLDGMRAFGARRVNVSGGEPLVSREWSSVAALAKELDYRVMLTTNGSFLAREMPAVIEHVDVLQLSFTDPEEWRRGLRAPDWVSELSRLFAELKAADIEIQVNFAISDAAFPEIETIADAVLGLAVPVDTFRFVHPMFLAPEVLAAHQADLSEFDTDGHFWSGFGTVPVQVDPEELLRIFHRVLERHPGRVGFFPEIDADEVAAYYRDPTYLPAPFRDFCAAPWTQVNLIPNGDVWVCYDLRLGNIHTDDAASIWNGSVARRLRERILARGLFGGCRGCFNKYSAVEKGTARGPRP